MTEIIYCMEFAKYLDLERICNYLMGLGHSLSQLKEKENCYRFEYKTLKELKQMGYKEFITKQLTPDINFIIAKKTTRSPHSVVVQSAAC
jgi:hypothetical protein